MKNASSFSSLAKPLWLPQWMTMIAQVTSGACCLDSDDNRALPNTNAVPGMGIMPCDGTVQYLSLRLAHHLLSPRNNGGLVTSISQSTKGQIYHFGTHGAIFFHSLERCVFPNNFPNYVYIPIANIKKIVCITFIISVELSSGLENSVSKEFTNVHVHS
jgi:hypothetical protein